jgi:hypothetical protein
LAPASNTCFGKKQREKSVIRSTSREDELLEEPQSGTRYMVESSYLKDALIRRIIRLKYPSYSFVRLEPAGSHRTPDPAAEAWREWARADIETMRESLRQKTYPQLQRLYAKEQKKKQAREEAQQKPDRKPI